jgi:uncharacterized protein YcbX
MQGDPSHSPSAQGRSGSVVGLWRYPVKSMMGEEVNAAEVTERGLVGDRRFAVVDAETGKSRARRIRVSGGTSSTFAPPTPRRQRRNLSYPPFA